jgi:hypothetical protein
MSKDSEALLALLKQRKEDAEAIQALWRALFREFTPPDFSQCYLWLKRHPLSTVVTGLEAAATCGSIKAQKLEEIEYDGQEATPQQKEEARWTRVNVLKYASRAMNNTDGLKGHDWTGKDE